MRGLSDTSHSEPPARALDIEQTRLQNAGLTIATGHGLRKRVQKALTLQFIHNGGFRRAAVARPPALEEAWPPPKLASRKAQSTGHPRRSDETEHKGRHRPAGPAESDEMCRRSTPKGTPEQARQSFLSRLSRPLATRKC